MSRELSTRVTVETPDGDLDFDSFAAAADSGYPIACEWFARCDGVAVVALSHPVLTAVPCCARCAAMVQG